ncbi:MAG: hypothetical protein GY861_14885 [bacterium]|nr:hypothetical protein [bacterium]
MSSLFNKLFGIFEKGVNMQSIIQDTLKQVERIIYSIIDRVRRRILLTLLELMFIIFGVFFLIIGAVLFFSRFFSWDIVLLVAGAVLLYIGLLLRLLAAKR